MSSILKALKKLENQAADKNHVRFLRPKTQIPIDDHEQISDHWRLKKRNVIIFAGFVFAVGAGLILSQILYKKKPELITKKEDILHKSVRLPEKKVAIPDNKTIPQKSVRSPEKKAAMPERVQKELSSRKGVKKFEPIAKAEKAAPPSAQKSRGNTAAFFNKKTSPLKQARKKTAAGKGSEKPEQNTKADRFASMPVKRSNQTKIEVQAIAWSNDPKSRLAVINGLILRERESIDNVIVMHIGKDAIIFKKGREEWKQMFGY